MSLTLVFRIFSAILFLNFVGVAFVPELWLKQANFSTTPDMITLGQAFGVSFLVFSFIGFRIQAIAGKALPEFGKVFSIVSLFFVQLISFHLITGQVSCPTATVNLLLNVVFSILFYLQSK